MAADRASASAACRFGIITLPRSVVYGYAQTDIGEFIE